MSIYSKVNLTNKILAASVRSGIILDADSVQEALRADGNLFKRSNVTGALGRLTPEYFTRVSLGKFTITDEKIELLSKSCAKKRGVAEFDFFRVISPGKSFSIESAMDKLASDEYNSSREKVVALIARLFNAGKISKSATGRYRRLDLAPVGKCSANNAFTQLIKRM